MTTDNTNNTNKALVPNFDFNFGGAQSTGLTIQTTDGRSVDLPANVGLTDFMPGGSGGEPIGQIKVGQLSDQNFAKQFFFQRSERTVDENTGETRRQKLYYGPFGAEMVVYPIGILPSHLNRSYMPKFDPRATVNEPLCRSENGIVPDAKYAGKLQGKNTQCAVIDPAKGLQIVCPFAQWGEADGSGKRTPPPCGEQYVVCVAFEHQGGIELAECYFRSSSATEGRNLVRELAGMQRRGETLFYMPIKLVLKLAGTGVSFVPVFNRSARVQISDEALPTFEAATQRWQDAVAHRLQRSQFVPDDQYGNGNGNGSKTQHDLSWMKTGAPRPTAKVVTQSGNGENEPLI